MILNDGTDFATEGTIVFIPENDASQSRICKHKKLLTDDVSDTTEDEEHDLMLQLEL